MPIPPVRGLLQTTGRKDQRILGAEWIDTGLGTIVEKPGAVALAADVESCDLFVERLERIALGCQVYLEDAARVTFDHSVLLPSMEP